MPAPTSSVPPKASSFKKADIDRRFDLLSAYPDDFTARDLDEHIADLLYRFGNRALGDTVHRVGRDLYRKLGRNDRVCGSAALCLTRGLPCDAVVDVFRAALEFRAADEDGREFDADIDFHKTISGKTAFKQMLTGSLGFGRADEALLRMLTDDESRDF